MRVYAAAFLGLVCTSLVMTGCGGPKSEPVAKTNQPAAKGRGASRVAIKHATDPDARLINKTPKDITVEELIGMKMPEGSEDLENYSNTRVGDFEKSTYRLHGTLKSIQHKKDGDYYLVMVGKTGAEAVIEVPDPELCKGSPILAEITKTRDELEAKYHPTDDVKPIGAPAVLEGVGFYGFKGKPGTGGTGRPSRLMPGTGFSDKK